MLNTVKFYTKLPYLYLINLINLYDSSYCHDKFNTKKDNRVDPNQPVDLDLHCFQMYPGLAWSALILAMSFLKVESHEVTFSPIVTKSIFFILWLIIVTKCFGLFGLFDS